MTAKFLIVSILDLLLGINFLSPAVLINNSSGNGEAAGPQGAPYLLPASETNYFPIRDWGVPDPLLNARSAMLYDLASEKVLLDINPGTRLPIASLTKLMTAVAVIENMDLGDTVEIKKSAIRRKRKRRKGKVKMVLPYARVGIQNQRWEN